MRAIRCAIAALVLSVGALAPIGYETADAIDDGSPIAPKPAQNVPPDTTCFSFFSIVLCYKQCPAGSHAIIYDANGEPALCRFPGSPGRPGMGGPIIVIP